MGTNYYMRLKKPIESMSRLGDIVRDGVDVENPDMVVKVLDWQKCHIAKCSWGWVPSFQAVPSEHPFDEQVRANEIYRISSLADIRAYLATGDYEVIDEYDCVISRSDFEKRVVGWEKVMRGNGYEGEMHGHAGTGDGLGAYLDPLGYQFCRTCFM